MNLRERKEKKRKVKAKVVLVPTAKLKHIEGFSSKRVQWLKKRVAADKVWTKPLCVERRHFLVMDGQHRMEVARALGLRCVPCILFSYDEVEFWSLRRNCEVSRKLVVAKSLSGDIYPYKTVKHRFPIEMPVLNTPLKELMAEEDR